MLLSVKFLLQRFPVEGFSGDDAAEEPLRHLRGPVRQPARPDAVCPARLHAAAQHGQEPRAHPLHVGEGQQGALRRQREAEGAAGNIAFIKG